MPYDSKMPSAFCWPDMTECFTTWIVEMKGVSWTWFTKIMKNYEQWNAGQSEKEMQQKVLSLPHWFAAQVIVSVRRSRKVYDVNMLTLWENSLNRFSKWRGSCQCHQVIKLQTTSFSTVEAKNGSLRGRIRTRCCVRVFGETDWLVCF